MVAIFIIDTITDYLVTSRNLVLSNTFWNSMYFKTDSAESIWLEWVQTPIIMTLVVVLLVWVHFIVRFICLIHSIMEKKWHSIFTTTRLEKNPVTLGGGRGKVLSKEHSANTLEGDFHKKKKDFRMVL